MPTRKPPQNKNVKRVGPVAIQRPIINNRNQANIQHNRRGTVVVQHSQGSIMPRLNPAFLGATMNSKKFAAEFYRSSGDVALKPGETGYMWVDFKNVGTVEWSPESTFLGTDNPRDHISIFSAPGWVSGARPAAINDIIKPGEIGRFNFTILAPLESTGRITQSFRMVQEGVSWFNQETARFEFNVDISDSPEKKIAIKNILNENVDYKKICMLSTWNIKCGISQYARNLYDSLIVKKYEVIVINNTVDYDDIYNTIIRLGYNTFIVQYEAAIIKDINKLFECIKRIKNSNDKVKIFFILHSEDQGLNRFDGIVDGFIYHKKATMSFTKTKCSFIPMGVPIFTPQKTKKEYRDKYSIGENKFVISTVGFMFSWKQHANFLNGIVDYLNKYDDIIVQMLTSFHSISNQQCIDENARIKEVINVNNIHKQVIHITDYLPQDELSERLYLSDLGFLWAGIETSSSSASLKEFVSSRLPIVKTNSSHHHDITAGSITTDKEMNKFIDKIIEVYNDRGGLNKLTAEMEDCYNQINYNQNINKFIDILFSKV